MIPDADSLAGRFAVKRYAADAAVQASVRADELPAEGDVESAVTWKRIIQAIEALQADAPADGEKVH